MTKELREVDDTLGIAPGLRVPTSKYSRWLILLPFGCASRIIPGGQSPLSGLRVVRTGEAAPLLRQRPSLRVGQLVSVRSAV